MFSFSPAMRSLSSASTSNSLTSLPELVTWKVTGPAGAVAVPTVHSSSFSVTAMALVVASAVALGTQPVSAAARAAAPTRVPARAPSGRSRDMGWLCFLSGCGGTRDEVAPGTGAGSVRDRGSGGHRALRGCGRCGSPRGAVLTQIEEPDDGDVAEPRDDLERGGGRVEVEDAGEQRAVPAGGRDGAADVVGVHSGAGDDASLLQVAD